MFSLVHRKKEWLRVLSIPIGSLFNTLTGRRRKNNVVMFHLGRSGSTALGDVFRHQPDIHWDGEIYPFLYYNRATTYMEYTDLPSRYAKDYLKYRMAGRTKKYYGFECKPFHLRWLGLSVGEYVGFLKTLGVDRWILLERKNILRILVSQHVALYSGKWHPKRPEDVFKGTVEIPIRRINIDHEWISLREGLERLSAEWEALKEALEQHAIKALIVDYDRDVKQDPMIAAKLVADHIGLRYRRVTSEYLRSTTAPLETLVSNFGDLKSELKGTRFEWMLNE